jgi:hypothetical protein
MPGGGQARCQTTTRKPASIQHPESHFGPLWDDGVNSSITSWCFREAHTADFATMGFVEPFLE